jgi:asparagine synthase (glutamine-hydrolysing)
MCGICGVLSDDLAEIEPAVRRMMDAMVHRGPNDAGYEQLNVGGYEFGPYAGFGFRRLAVLDLTAAGHQPMFNPRTGDCLVFNGEIYNFRRLRGELQCEGVAFHGHSDTEVLLHALSLWGEAALQRIQGMYAFAFFEAKTRRILLARDPLGIKPLYVASAPKRIVFASEIRALRSSRLVDDAIDVGGVAGMLAYGAVQSPRTIYRDIRSFPAGRYQWLDAGSVTGRSPPPPRRFWHYPAASTAPVDAQTAAANVQLLLHDAVLRHLVADVPVGIFLSAGIDSTILATLAREFTPQVTAFTVGFGAVHGQDEVAIASETAKTLGIKHAAVDLDFANLPHQWQDWIGSMDSPSIDGFNTYVVSRRLAQEQIVVGLSGLGADELFGGYPSFARAPRLSKLLKALQFIPQNLRASLLRRIGALHSRSGALDKLADLVEGNLGVADIAVSLRRTLSNRRLASLGLAAEDLQLQPNYLTACGGLNHDNGIDSFGLVSRSELTHYMGDTLLRDTDANSMLQSLEVRVPFLDLPLVEYVSSLPGHVKQSGSVASKSLLRIACRKTLRDDISRRPKTGFVLPIGDWMRREMRDSCEAAINRLASAPFLEGREVRRIWSTFLSDEHALHWSRPLSLVVLGSSIG